MYDSELTNNIKIAVIGLGYVGLPLARLMSTKFQTIQHLSKENIIQKAIF